MGTAPSTFIQLRHVSFVILSGSLKGRNIRLLRGSVRAMVIDRDLFYGPFIPAGSMPDRSQLWQFLHPARG